MVPQHSRETSRLIFMKLKYFIAAIALTLVGGLAMAKGPRGHAVQPKKEIGVQLYSMRQTLDKGGKFHNNLPGLLKSLSASGYTHVEAANYDHDKGLFYGMTPAEFKKACNDAGLKLTSSHTNRALTDEELKSGDRTEFFKWWDKTITDHKAAGCDYLVMPWMAVPKTLSDLQQQCDALSEVARRAAKQGIKFGYHNHSHEFQEVEGTKMFDYMLEHTDPAMLFEMDVFWAAYGHAAPVDYFNKYPGRFKLLHIKDLREIGQSGMVGFDAIFKNADKAGMENYYVEVEEFTGDPEDGIRQSADYLKKARFVKPSYSPSK